MTYNINIMNNIFAYGNSKNSGLKPVRFQPCYKYNTSVYARYISLF